MSTINRRYKWWPDLPDHRDHLYTAHWLDIIRLPSSVDLRAQCPPVYDQGELGSCTAQAVAGALEFDQKKQGLLEWTPSRLFIYFNERDREGTVATDSGASIRDGIKSANSQGACDEKLWPYDIVQFATKPPKPCYDAALLHRTLSYQRVHQSITQMKACLAAGYPIIFGISVYDSFESAEVAQTGNVPMPNPDEGFLGGHAMLCVGYEDSIGAFLFRNSWGTGWGQQGYGTIPYVYLLSRDLASDFWMVRTVE